MVLDVCNIPSFEGGYKVHMVVLQDMGCILEHMVVILECILEGMEEQQQDTLVGCKSALVQLALDRFQGNILVHYM